jgi:hypothetical protein
LNIFDKSSAGNCIALHYNFEWTLENNVSKSFECINVIELNAQKNKIIKLSIIFDTYPIREDFKLNK